MPQSTSIRFFGQYLSRRLAPPVPKPAGRGVAVFPDDLFITSYPKSGNTWCRFIYSNLVHGQQDNFTDTLDASSDIYWHTNESLKQMRRPRVLKSHEYFDPRYPRTVYVVRDVRSVIVSYHSFLARFGAINPDVTYLEFTQKMINGELGSYGSWKDNVLSWIGARGNDSERFCLVRYEDLRRDGLETVRKIVDFLGADYSDEEIHRALELSSLERMRRLEREESELRDFNTARGKKDVAVVGSGELAGWRNKLDADTLRLIERDSRDVLELLGYKW